MVDFRFNLTLILFSICLCQLVKNGLRWLDYDLMNSEIVVNYLVTVINELILVVSDYLL